MANAASVSLNCTKTSLANSLNLSFIKGKPVFSNGPGSLPRNPPNCTILDNWVFKNSILADELFAKALRRHENSLSVIIYVQISLIVRVTNHVWWKI